MACAKGCCSTQAEHYRSLRFANPNAPHSKTVTDVHDTHVVDVTESADRQDVTVKIAAPVTASLRS